MSIKFEFKYFKYLLTVVLIFISFILPDISLRIFSNKYLNFYEYYNISPNFFTLSWILLFIVLLYCLPKKIRMISYSVLLILFNIICFSQHLHFAVLDRFYGFSDILLVSNAKDYMFSLFDKTSTLILICNIVSLIIGTSAIILMKYTEQIKYRYINITFLILLICFRVVAFNSLGAFKNDLTWEDNNNPKNIYINLTNNNKGLEVSGLYEYSFRNFYLFLYNNYFVNKDKLTNEIEEHFNNNSKELQVNEYTNIFKDKNIIYILMESIDSWLVTKDVMPTLYKLQNEGLNFTNKYTPVFGGGQTINTEFATHTGLYAINSGKAIYNFTNNSYPTSLENMFKNNGYKTTSIHANDGDFYNRRQLHIALGFDEFYFLKEEDNIDKSYNYFKDTNLINDEIFNLMVSDEKFLTYIITYSAHLPYNNSNDKCANDPYNLAVNGYEGLSCIRNLARETDEMIKLLIEKLDKNNKLDDTVLVLVTDHYTYGFDEDYVTDIKNTNNIYLLQNTPFVIWNKNIDSKQIDLMVDTADILPTLFNMFGINYNPNYYSGEDIFSKDRDNFVYFDTNVFYDGNIFYDGNSLSNDYINEKLKKIKNKININDKIINSNYFKTIN